MPLAVEWPEEQPGDAVTEPVTESQDDTCTGTGTCAGTEVETENTTMQIDLLGDEVATPVLSGLNEPVIAELGVLSGISRPIFLEEKRGALMCLN